MKIAIWGATIFRHINVMAKDTSEHGEPLLHPSAANCQSVGLANDPLFCDV
jgi:hypothetical protein